MRMRRRALLAALVSPAGAFAVARPGEAVDWPGLTLLDGTRLRAADWRDRAAVVVFWSTTCPFCRRHNPLVEKLHRATAGRALRVLGVAREKDPAHVARHAAAMGYTFPMTLETPALVAAFATRRVLPLTVTVDRQGRLRQTIPGEMFEEDVLELAALAG